MSESSWLQRALESAVYEANAVEDKIGLARLAVLERLVSVETADKNDEDTLLGTLDTLRALEWERLATATERFALTAG